MDISGSGDSRISLSAPMSAMSSRRAGHPLRFVDETETGGLKPYVLVRGRLEGWWRGRCV